MKYRFTKKFDIGDVVEMNEDMIKDFGSCIVPDFLEEVKEPEYRYCDTGNPIKEDDGYWYSDSNGDFGHEVWSENYWHARKLSAGNVFETHEGAEKHQAFLKARAKIKAFIGTKDRTISRFSISYNHLQSDFDILPAGDKSYSEFKFCSERDAEECIRLYSSELKTVLGVEG